LTLDDLATVAARVLDHLRVAASSGRVRSRPDGRTIRYYTTLGLVDPPGKHRGRIARYSHRHLAQVVVIKRLQADGVTLVELQRTVVGASLERLRSLAGPGYDAAAALVLGTTGRDAAVPEEISKHGSDSPSPAARLVAPTAGQPLRVGATYQSRRPAAATIVEHVVQVPLGNGVTLTLPAAFPVSTERVAQLRRSITDLLGSPSWRDGESP